MYLVSRRCLYFNCPGAHLERTFVLNAHHHQFSRVGSSDPVALGLPLCTTSLPCPHPHPAQSLHFRCTTNDIPLLTASLLRTVSLQALRGLDTIATLLLLLHPHARSSNHPGRSFREPCRPAPRASFILLFAVGLPASAFAFAFAFAFASSCARVAAARASTSTQARTHLESRLRPQRQITTSPYSRARSPRRLDQYRTRLPTSPVDIAP